MNRTPVALLAVAGLLAPALTACGGPPIDDVIVLGTTDTLSASKEAPAPLDPAFAYDVTSWNILRQTVQTLLIQHRDEGEPVPEAAESCGFTDSRSERYVCILRKDLTFANGDPITASDVKYSIDRARALKSDSGVFALLSTIDTVETRGDREVVFHLKIPDATLPFKLSTPVAGIVDPDIYDKKKLRGGFEVDGSGPYMLRTEIFDHKLVSAVFTKNPNYQGSLKVNNDRVELRSFQDADEMGAALNKGRIDVMTRTMLPAQIDRLTADSDAKIDLIDTPGREIRYLAFNTNAPAVKSKAVRQAMAQVIDRAELVTIVYRSQAEPLYSLVPAGVTGHSNSFFNKYGDPDVGKAKSLLERAGITTPVKLTLHYTTDHYGAATETEFELLKLQLNDSGLFVVDIKGTPWEKFRVREKKGEYEVYGMGWFPDFPDPDNYLAPFLDKDNFLGSPYSNSVIRNTLIPGSRRATNRPSASIMLTRIQDIVANDVPVLPLWQSKQYVAANDAVTGTAYTFNSCSTLQLWELSRGLSS
ncbi:ABC transporter substrate-binding protein [Streptomyces sp. KS_5]|uniref:ABC transporter substrate-binding protein n=1 Tax=Streptomyces sp. KS_5 TaxID=1881018 RepID=UPI0008973A71|nr:ABC transporter substrate-binding protein [Streptomyces sp. KS_5]SEE34109.1 peptide/nickel transport system substrate-binding protein [Streptomyces sp. KS_5]